MSNNNIKYIVNKGDTLKQISHRFYGTPAKYLDIFNASNFKSKNPAKIYAGEVAYIPKQDGTDTDEKFLNNIDKSEVSIVLNGNRFFGWQTNNITCNILEYADGFSFSFPYDFTTNELLLPFSYALIEIYIGKDLILTGHITNLSIDANPENMNITVEGRSKIGLALESHIQPVKQYNHQKLSAIAKEILLKYGVGVKSDKDITIKKSNVRAGDTVFTFINDFVVENNLLLYSLPSGDVIITTPDTKAKATQTLQLGDGSTQRIITQFDGDSLFSSYKLHSQVKGKNMVNVITNPFIDIYRPWAAIKQDIIDVNLANKTFYLTSFGKSSKIKIEVIGWRKKDGSLWKKNDCVIVYSPTNYILKESKFIITEVQYLVDVNKEYVELDCAIPEAYSNQDIKEVFWK